MTLAVAGHQLILEDGQEIGNEIEEEDHREGFDQDLSPQA